MLLFQPSGILPFELNLSMKEIRLQVEYHLGRIYLSEKKYKKWVCTVDAIQFSSSIALR